MAKRPPIPAELERQVLLEAGHRCAIHTCREHPVEIAHIKPWSQVRDHRFENLIALCPTCHTRYDRREIDRKSMLTYKQNAWWHSHRYSELEKRLLLKMAKETTAEAWVFSQFELLLQTAIADGLLVDTGESRPPELSETLRQKRYRLTPAGAQFVSLLKTVH